MRYCVKVLAPQAKQWRFLSSTGGLVRLRIHASLTEDKDKAERIAGEIERENAGYKAKAVVFSQ